MTLTPATAAHETHGVGRGPASSGKARLLFGWSLRFLALWLIYLVSFAAGGMFVGSVLPADAPSEPGLVSPGIGVLAISIANVAVIGALVLTSRWRGWKLAAALALAHYGAVTFLMQVESWYFLSPETVGPELLVRLFLMGVPTAFVAVPLSVWVLGRWRPGAGVARQAEAPPVVRRRTIWKVAVLAVVYVALYFVAGYFIAWQNPELRAFYGEPGEALPFLAHMSQPSVLLLVPFQLLRGVLWILCALPIIRGSAVGPWWTAILVGVFFSLPQNVVHILENPLMPHTSVRHAHMVETASSTFLFGMLVVILLNRELGARGTGSRGPTGIAA